MKRWIHGAIDASDFEIKDIMTVVLVDDIDAYHPRNPHISASVKGTKVDYTSLTHDQLMQLNSKERESIHDINVLRKLKLDELSPQQLIEVTHANKENFHLSPNKVKDILNKLQNCSNFHIWDTEKNKTLMDKIWKLGGSVSDTDARNIINMLKVNNYVESTLSYLDTNWNNLLMVFGYEGGYTFEPSRNGKPVTISNLNLYIKIDVDSETRLGYAVMSFHDAEFKMSYPYQKL